MKLFVEGHSTQAGGFRLFVVGLLGSYLDIKFAAYVSGHQVSPFRKMLVRGCANQCAAILRAFIPGNVALLAPKIFLLFLSWIKTNTRVFSRFQPESSFSGCSAENEVSPEFFAAPSFCSLRTTAA